MPSTRNAIAIIKKLLMDNADITDLVEDRIRTEHFYNMDDASVEYPIIILDPLKGMAGRGKSHQIFDLEVYVYSKYTIDQCFEIYELIYNTLHSSRMVNSNFEDKGTLVEIERPETGFNDKIMSYYCIATYKVMTAG